MGCRVSEAIFGRDAKNQYRGSDTIAISNQPVFTLKPVG